MTNYSAQCATKEAHKCVFVKIRFLSHICCLSILGIFSLGVDGLEAESQAHWPTL